MRYQKIKKKIKIFFSSKNYWLKLITCHSIFFTIPNFVYSQACLSFDNELKNGIACVASYKNILYAGGGFDKKSGSNSNYIAKWAQSKWVPLEQEIDGPVSSMIVFNSELFIVSNFTKTGSFNSSYISKWNGNQWSVVGNKDDTINGEIYSIIVHKDKLIIGGNFTGIGAKPISYIACWDGNSWTSIGGKINGPVQKISSFKNDLYVVTRADSLGQGIYSTIFLLENNLWKTHGSLNSVKFVEITSLQVYDNGLFVGGQTSSGNKNLSCHNLVKWNSAEMECYDFSNTGNGVLDIFLHNNKLFIACYFLPPLSKNPEFKIIAWDGVKQIADNKINVFYDEIKKIFVFENKLYLIKGGCVCALD